MKDNLDYLVKNFLNSCISKPQINFLYGCNLPLEILIESFLEFSKSGINPLNEYMDLIMLYSNARYEIDSKAFHKPTMTRERADYFRGLISGMSHWNVSKLFSKSEIEKMLKHIRDAEYYRIDEYSKLSKYYINKSRKQSVVKIECTEKVKLELIYNKLKRTYILKGDGISETGNALKMHDKILTLLNEKGE